MKHSLKYMIAALAMATATAAQAQTLSSAYFMDGYTFGHELNPAKDYDRQGYVSMPFLLGHMNVGLNGNVGVSDIFFPQPDGRLGTFLHPSVSYDEAMKGLKTNNRLKQSLRMDLISFGFHAFHGYNTFTLGLREDLNFRTPKSLFSMLKKLENQSYNIGNTNVSADAFVEVALGHSHDVTEAVRVGGKLKILLGAGYADVNLDKLNMDLTGEDKWTVTADASAEVGVTGFTWGQMKTQEYSQAYLDTHPGSPATYQEIDFGNIDLDSPGLGGVGVGFDLGAEWDLGKQGWVEGLVVGAAINDLGFIHWKNVAKAQNNGDPFEFDGFHNIKIGDGTGVEMEDQTDDLGDRLSNLYSLRDAGTTSKNRALGATLHISADYTLPMYKKVNFSFLSTTYIRGQYSWNEERLFANYHPCKWFEMGINGGVGTFGPSFGWILNLHPRGFNFFVGCDHTIGKVSKQMIPLNSNANFEMGINFPIGKSHAARFEKL